MSLQRKSAKRDASEPAIVEALEKAGCQVVRLSQTGIPDLLVCLPDARMVLVECKTGRGKLTPEQVAFIDYWQGKVVIAHSPYQALLQLELIKRRSHQRAPKYEGGFVIFAGQLWDQWTSYYVEGAWHYDLIGKGGKSAYFVHEDELSLLGA
jgi:Holliday junction resolvase